ncbi:MAG: iron-containing redox enzyme family protein [Solirubrobacteraceae bacterium]
MDILAALDETRRSLDVLQHPFYVRWNAGDLSAAELSLYATEYRHAVIALAGASASAAAMAPPALPPELRRHAEEEAAHVALWDQFAGAAGAPPARNAGEAGLPETQRCVAAWTAGGDLLEHLGVLYVLEAAQPAISKTKRAGLVSHYGYSPEGPATEYFRVHERLDVEHARQAADIISAQTDDLADRAKHGGRMVQRADAALRANWVLLTGVEVTAHG